MLSFKYGRPLCIVDGGRFDDDILRIDEEKEDKKGFDTIKLKDGIFNTVSTSTVILGISVLASTATQVYTGIKNISIVCWGN